MLNVNHKPLAALIFLLSVLIIPQVYAQTCVDAIPASTPTSDFEVHNNGTVTHTATGLMWKVCAEGQTWQSSDGSCSGVASDHSWQQALQAPQTLNTGGGYAGYADWRLPSIKELTSIIEFKCNSPAINLTVFNNAPAGGVAFKSSSHDAYQNFNVITLFNDGIMFPYDRYSSGNQKVRLVRNAAP